MSSKNKCVMYIYLHLWVIYAFVAFCDMRVRQVLYFAKMLSATNASGLTFDGDVMDTPIADISLLKLVNTLGCFLLCHGFSTDVAKLCRVVGIVAFWPMCHKYCTSEKNVPNQWTIS